MSGPSISELFIAIGAGLGVTLFMTVVSFVLGAVLAVPIAVMRTTSAWFVSAPAMAFIEIARGIPPLVWLLLLYFGISPILELDALPAAIIGLSLISAGYIAENLRAGIENVHVGQREAAMALGISPSRAFTRVIAPQAVNLALPPSASYAVGLLKDTAIASLIGVADVIFIAQNIVARGAPSVPVFLIAGACYLIISVPLSYFSRHVDYRIRQKVVIA